MALSTVEGGATYREHYQSIWRQTGVRPDELDPVECPPQALYLWEYFKSMCLRRTSNGYSANALSHQDVEAWARLNGVALSPFEVSILDDLEQAYLKHHAPKAAK